ncbi:hypothetical protein OIU77_014184 [Salix suchowensis]|uniref:Uncharacterized protein n=1 Tax=Salix suchowensis TaxID=1278906 RepID=A0ABQ8ZWG8_9ROSI|nr:hypothetical protein OIU77_014184 [Salix suchowensis]
MIRSGNRRESVNYGGGYKGSGGWSWWHQGSRGVLFVNMGKTDGKRTYKQGFAIALSRVSSLVKGRIGRVHYCIAGEWRVAVRFTLTLGVFYFSSYSLFYLMLCVYYDFAFCCLFCVNLCFIRHGM